MNKPTRTAAVDHLTENLSFCLASAPDIKGNAEKINAALAFCELAVSLPPAWFTYSERVTVCTLIQTLYGDPIAFISNLNDGNISYYNKMIAKMRERGEGGTWELDDLVMLMIQKHTEEFGSLTI